MADRWDPIYDAEELKTSIRNLAESGSLFVNFYDIYDHRPDLCQGDILELNAAAPVLDSDGEVAGFGPMKYWAFVGNSCDTDRDITTTQAAPLYEIDDLMGNEVDDLTRYVLSRHFYFPECHGRLVGGLMLDWTEICCVDIRLLRAAPRVARLKREAWFLFHGCLVRYLARDDGRNA